MICQHTGQEIVSPLDRLDQDRTIHISRAWANSPCHGEEMLEYLIAELTKLRGTVGGAKMIHSMVVDDENAAATLSQAATEEGRKYQPGFTARMVHGATVDITVSRHLDIPALRQSSSNCSADSDLQTV